MIKLQNPFITGGYVNPEYFCDREKETGHILIQKTCSVYRINKGSY